MGNSKSPCIDNCVFTGPKDGALVVEEHVKSVANGKI